MSSMNEVLLQADVPGAKWDTAMDCMADHIAINPMFSSAANPGITLKASGPPTARRTVTRSITADTIADAALRVVWFAAEAFSDCVERTVRRNGAVPVG